MTGESEDMAANLELMSRTQDEFMSALNALSKSCEISAAQMLSGLKKANEEIESFLRSVV